MSEKEQQLNKKEALKKAYIGNAIMLFVLGVAIILAVFAWFVTQDTRSRLNGISFLSSDNRDIRFFTQAGTVLEDGSLSFSGDNLNNENIIIGSGTIMPGQKRYYKTTIQNYDPDDYVGTLTLQSILVNKMLSNIRSDSNYTALSFGALAKYNSSLNQELYDEYNLDSFKDHIYYLTMPETYYHSDGTIDPDWDLVNVQYICSDIFLPGKEGSLPGTFDIIWEFEVSGEAILNSNNELESMMGRSLLEFQYMKFVVNDVVGQTEGE